jgi:hypothetical protein
MVYFFFYFLRGELLSYCLTVCINELSLTELLWIRHKGTKKSVVCSHAIRAGELQELSSSKVKKKRKKLAIFNR